MHHSILVQPWLIDDQSIIAPEAAIDLHDRGKKKKKIADENQVNSLFHSVLRDSHHPYLHHP